MKQGNFRLSTRIIIGAITTVVASAIVLLTIEQMRLRDIYINNLRADLEKSLKIEKLQLSQAVKEITQDVLLLSNTPPVSGIVRAALNRRYDARDSDTRARWEVRLQQIFSAYSASHPEYYQVRYIGVADGGREIVRIDNRGGKVEVMPPAGLQAKGDRDYFKATLGLRAGEVYLSEFDLNQERGVIEQPYRPTLRAATPVFTPDGQIFGMVVINMDVGALLENAASKLPAGVQAYISNMKGDYLLHPDAQRSFGFERGRKDNITTDFPLLKTAFDQQVSEHVPLQVAKTKAGAQYIAAERIYFDPSNPARFLLLAYHIPDAVAAQRKIMIPPAHIISGFIIMLLVGGIVLLVLRRTFAPLEQITLAADKIAAGDHDVMLPQAGSGEIGMLASSLGIMLSKLTQREREILQANAKLEERVGKRTCELEAVNELLHEEILRGKKLQQETETLLLRNQALMQTSMDGIHVIDMQGNIVTANDAFCRMLGYTQEEAAGLNIVDWDTQFSAEESRERLKNLIGKSALIETLYRRKDGTLINAEVCASGVKIEGYDFVYSSSRDITWRKQVETVLQESEEKFRSIFEQAAVGAAIIDSKTGQFQQVNKKYADIVGLDIDEMLATSFMEITHPEDLQSDLDNMKKLKNGLIAEFTMEKRYIHKNGSIVWVSLTVSPLWMGKLELSQHLAMVTDITERKRIENELRIAAAAFETQDAIMITDIDGNIIRVNPAFSDITGYSADEVQGKNPRMMNSGRHEQPFYALMWQQLLHTGVWSGEIWDRHKTGRIYLKWLTITAVKNERQTTICYVAIFSDITARKQIEEVKLRESEERFRGTLEQAAVGIAHALLDGHFQQVNQKFCDIVGYTRDELLHMRFHDITFSDDLDENIGCIRQLLAGEISTFSIEKRYVRKDRSLVWVNLTVSMLRDVGGTPKYTIGVIEDITGRKRVEQQLRDLTAHLQTVREEEKTSVAREIHDDLGGALTALKIDTYWLECHLPVENEMAPLRERIKSMSATLNDTVSATRRIITDLRPTILDDLGLLAALEWHAAQFSKRTGIECRITCTGEECHQDKLGKIPLINLFRIFQESLTNVARHSGASRVKVELLYEDEKVILSIGDNGCGLPEGHTLAATSHGIRGMRERVEQLGGVFELFNNTPGDGLTVRIILPLPANNDKEGAI